MSVRDPSTSPVVPAPAAPILTAVASIAALKALAGTDITGTVEVLSRIASAIPDGLGGVYTWNSTDTRSDDSSTLFTIIQPDSGGVGRWNQVTTGSFLQSGTGAVARSVQSKERDLLHIADYGGASGASAAVNTTALQNAITQAVALGKGGVEIGPGGTWALTAGTNWITRDIAIIGRGKPILDFSAGTGVGFKLDAGGAGANIRGMVIENFIIKGGASITDIFYSRGCVASQFKNLEAREGTTTGFKILLAVLNTYEDCRVSNDSLAMTTTPATYISLDNDGTVGNHSQENTFINTDCSGKGATSTSTGIALIDATENTFYGGTCESLDKGIDIQNDQCRLNTFVSFDLEDNVTNDAIVKGTGNTFHNTLSQSACSGNNIDITTGKGTCFLGGGYLRLVNLAAGSSNTSFIGVGLDESLGGTLAIQGTGSYTRFGCSKIGNTGLVTGTWWDVSLGAIGASDAAIGVVGEYVETAVASPGVTLTTATSKTVGSVSLTAGDWDISGTVTFGGNVATNVTQFRGGSSQTNNTLGGNGTVFVDFRPGGAVMFTVNDPSYAIPTVRMSLGATTTVYLVANAVFTVNSCTAYGVLRCRRIR